MACNGTAFYMPGVACRGIQDILMKMRDFWDVALCSLVEIDRRLRDVYCLYHQGLGIRLDAPLKRLSTSTRLHSSISQKAVVFMIPAVRDYSLKTFLRRTISLGRYQRKRLLGMPGCKRNRNLFDLS
jgi:hypothetical protein